MGGFVVEPQPKFDPLQQMGAMDTNGWCPIEGWLSNDIGGCKRGFGGKDKEHWWIIKRFWKKDKRH